MYLVNLRYHKSLDEVDSLLKHHVEWLDEHFACGHFIAAGRKTPREGGMILVKDMSATELTAILKQDPFQSVADYEITQIHFSRVAQGFEDLKGL